MLCEETGSVDIARLCPRCGSDRHGRPLAVPGRGILVSLSYAGDLVAVAWTSTGGVGIDIEEAGPDVDGCDRLEWTRREATFKAGGELPVETIRLPDGYVGSVAGVDVSWRLVGPAAPSR